jgi:Uma2 family endonuclease
MVMVVQGECARRLFTADEYMRMAEVGILGEDERIELIHGEILTMSPIGPRHCTAVDRFNYLLVTALGARAWVRVQSTVRLLPDTMPEPDLAVLRRQDYSQAHPTPADTLLVIEVAETSLAYDRGRKAALYAEAGILEYWVADTTGEAVEVHREPDGQRYRMSTRLTGADTVSPVAFPDVVVRLPEIFGWHTPGA